MAIDVLHDLLGALENENKARVVELSPALSDAFNRQRSREQAYDNLAITVKTQGGESDPGSAATDYLNAVTAADQARMAVDTSILTYLSGETSAASASDLIQSAVERERTLEESIAEFDSALDGSELSIPPILVITGPDRVPFPKGMERTFGYTVANVGGEPAANVTLELDTELALDISPADLGSLPSDTEASIELIGAVSTTGVHTVGLSVSSDSTSDSISISAGVASKVQYLQSALQDVERLKSDVAELRSSAENDQRTRNDRGNRSSGDNGLRGLERKAGQVAKKLEQAIQRIEGGKDGQAVDNMINAAINQIGAFNNQVDSFIGEQLDDGEAALLRHNAKEVIPRLETAKTIE